MVYRAYVEKKSGLDNEARALKNELVSLLGINSLENVRVLNRYALEGLEKELFEYSKGFKKTTNNRMELLAVINGLKALNYKCSVKKNKSNNKGE